MKNKSNVYELLDETNNLISDIKKKYKEAKIDKEIDSVSRPKVKSCFDHLRSVLDYVAQDLYETIDAKKRSKKTKKGIYFPYGGDKETFKQHLNDNLPGLDAEYLKLLESMQPYVCGDLWLLQLCKICNLNKHRRLQNQERKNSCESMLNIGNFISVGANCDNVVIKNCYVNGVPLARSDKIVITKGKSILEIKEEINDFVPVWQEYEYVNFILSGYNIDVLDFIVKSYNYIKQFVDRIYLVNKV